MEQKEEYLVLLKEGCGEIEEKKSRFICNVRKCTTEEEAVAFIEEMKKKYWDARHNCSAFVLGERGEITRCSDDGEPSQTAGRPMLEVLLGSKIRNICVVVTRYFGGTLLGTGGLVRAYSQAVKAGLMASETGRMVYGARFLVETDYNGIGKLLYLLGKWEITPEGSEYGADVKLTLTVAADMVETMEKEFVEVTQGRVKITKIEDTYFIDKKALDL